MATFNSQDGRHPGLKLVLITLILCTLSNHASADSQTNIFAARLEAEFRAAQTRYLSDTNNATNAWQFARASFNLSDSATNEAQRADIAKLGIAACKALVEREPKSAPGHYYLAMNLGELAEAEAPSFAAYRLVKEIEREFKTAVELDEHIDFAGPVRNLGLLYRDAPGWPISIGSKHKARELLERSVELAPGDPENHLNLAESLLRWKERDAALKELRALDTIWADAQKQFTGPAWEESWHDWSVRRETLRAKLDDSSESTKPARKK